MTDQTPTRSADPLRHAASLLWPNLPVLLAGSVLVTVAAALVRLAAPQPGAVTVLGYGLLVLPTLAALLRGSQVLLADDVFGLRHLGPALLRGIRPTVMITAVPMLSLTLAVIAAGQWAEHRQGWLLLSLGLSLAVGLVTAGVGVVALPYVLATRCPVLEGWVVATYVVTRRPVPVLAVVSAIVLLGWAGGHLSLALMIIFPGPLALLWAVAAGSATTDSRRRLDDRAAARAPVT